MSTHNLCFRAKIRKNVYPYTPQFCYIKVGCKGVFVTRTCFRDVRTLDKPCIEELLTEVNRRVNIMKLISCRLLKH